MLLPPESGPAAGSLVATNRQAAKPANALAETETSDSGLRGRPESAMTDQRLYRQARLTIGQLAERLGTSEHTLRRLINQRLAIATSMTTFMKTSPRRPKGTDFPLISRAGRSRYEHSARHVDQSRRRPCAHLRSVEARPVRLADKRAAARRVGSGHTLPTVQPLITVSEAGRMVNQIRALATLVEPSRVPKVSPDRRTISFSRSRNQRRQISSSLATRPMCSR